MWDLQAGPRGKGRIKEQGHPLHHSQPDPRAAPLSHPIVSSHPNRVPHPNPLSPNISAPSPSPPGSCGFGRSPSTPGGHFWTQGAPEHGQSWDALLPASLQAKRTRRDEERGIIPSSLWHLLPTSAPARLLRCWYLSSVFMDSGEQVSLHNITRWHGPPATFCSQKKQDITAEDLAGQEQLLCCVTAAAKASSQP